MQSFPIFVSMYSIGYNDNGKEAVQGIVGGTANPFDVSVAFGMGIGNLKMSTLRVGDLLARNAVLAPGATALIADGRIITWHELDHATRQLAAGFGELGLDAGDRVATMLGNSAAGIETLFAMAKAGLAAVPIDHDLAPMEVRAVLDKAKPKAVLVDAEFLASLRPVLIGSGASVYIVRGAREGLPPLWFDYDEVRDFAWGGAKANAFGPDTVSAVHFLGADFSRVCEVTHRQILLGIDKFFRRASAPQHGPFLQMIPPSSRVGMWMAVAAVYRGAGNVMQAAFDPAKALRAIATHGVAQTGGTPVMLGQLCDAYEPGAHNLSSLKLFTCTGELPPGGIMSKAMQIMSCDFYQGFSGEEACQPLA